MSNGEGSQDVPDDAASFLDRVKHAFTDLAEVKVVTIVGNIPVTIDTEGDSTTTTLGKTTIEGGAIVTIVKLLDGDVTTVIADELVGNDEVRAAHVEQVAASLDVIPGHLATLVDMAERLLDL